MELPNNAKEAYVKLSVGNMTKQVEVNAISDTGAMSNLLPLEVFRKLQGVQLEKTPVCLFAFGGIAHVSSEWNTVLHSIWWISWTNAGRITDVQENRLSNTLPSSNRQLWQESRKGQKRLSYTTDARLSLTELLSKWNLRTWERVLTEFPNVFDAEYTINTDTKILPVVHLTQRVPVSLRVKFKAELDSLMKQSIISLVTKPILWVNSFVCVSKANGSVRLCRNLKVSNKTIQRPHFVTPTFEDVVSQLHEAK